MRARSCNDVDHGVSELGQVIRFSAAYKMAIHDDRSVFPNGAGVDEVVFNTWRTGYPYTRVNACRDREPSTMADRRHTFLLFGKFCNQSLYHSQTSKSIRHEAAWQKDRIKVGRVYVINFHIGFARITVFSRIDSQSLLARNNKLCAGFDQAKLGVPQLEVFINIPHKREDSLSKERFRYLNCQLMDSFLPLSDLSRDVPSYPSLYEV